MVLEILAAEILPYIAIGIGLFLLVFAYATLSAVGGFVGWDLTQFLAQPIFRVAALIIFLYIVYWLVKTLAQAAINKETYINPFLLSVILALGVLSFNFGFFGKLLATTGAPEPAPIFPVVDWESAFLGALVGGAAVFGIDVIGSKFKRRLPRIRLPKIG